MAYEDRIMRMANSVPQRTVQRDRPNIGFERAGPARMEPATYNRPSRTLGTEVTPMASRGAPPNIGIDRAGGYGTLNDFRQLMPRMNQFNNLAEPAMDSGQYLASRFGGGLDDAAGMNGDAMGMIEGAGFDVASKTTDDRVVERLWKQAVNSLPIGTPQPQLIEEWEKLKEEFYRRKYGE